MKFKLERAIISKLNGACKIQGECSMDIFLCPLNMYKPNLVLAAYKALKYKFININDYYVYVIIY